MNSIFKHESEVRSYSRSWPTVFDRASGHTLIDEEGRRFIDFFAGAGVMNYGHNNPVIGKALLDYLSTDKIVHALDKATVAKRTFLETFHDVILEPRGLDYKVMFPGPTGTNAVEAALKLARKVTGRETIVGFTNAFHGMTLGSLSVSGNAMKRDGAGIALHAGVNLPYDGYMGADADTIEYFAHLLEDGGSGFEKPAAVIVETVQAEGGMQTASFGWLQRLEALCHEHEILLIVDDIQVGNGRTGTFFSFEKAGITPDIVTLSKSLSGYGLPFAVTIFKRELDVWLPGEHNGTFRGFNPAMVTATETLNTYWRDEEFSKEIDAKAALVTEVLDDLVTSYPELEGERRGRGLIQGVACKPGIAEKVVTHAFERGLIVETSGADSEVIKLLPPLTIDEDALIAGLFALDEAITAALDVDRRETLIRRKTERLAA